MGKNNKSKSLKTLKGSNPSKKDGKQQQQKKSKKGKMGFVKGASLATGKSSCDFWRNCIDLPSCFFLIIWVFEFFRFLFF
jgi:hypothetical protein